MRGESLDTLSRELNVPAHWLSEWRDRVLIAAEGALRERERDARDDEIERLRAKVGEITMANELHHSKVDKQEAGRRWAGRGTGGGQAGVWPGPCPRSGGSGGQWPG